MKKLSENFSFLNTNDGTRKETDTLERHFKDGEYVSQQEVKNYAKKIAEIVRQTPRPEEQKLILINLLKDKEILIFADLMTKVKYPEFVEDEKELNEIKLMVLDTIKAIKKQIIYNLQGYLNKDLCFFIKEEIERGNGGINTKMILSDEEFKEYFFKETNNFPIEGVIGRYNNLKLLSKAFDTLQNPDVDMPYVIRPTIIEESPSKRNTEDEDGHTTVGFTTEVKDLATVEDVLLDKKDTIVLTQREMLLAIVDCLRGAKFLADNGLTLTDINTFDTGKNIGIDKKTKKGILFDLDGLMEANKKLSFLVGPQSQDLPKTLAHHSPEYRRMIIGQYDIKATTKAMIWEFGETLKKIANKELDKITKDKNYTYDKNKIIKVMDWNEIVFFSEKMTATNPDERPDFDVCIDTLTKIIEEYFKEENEK